MNKSNCNEEMKVADVRNWVLNNMFNNGKPSKHDIWFADMLEKNHSVGGHHHRTLNGSWISTWEVEQLFITFFEDGAWAFRAMGCDVTTYVKDNCPIEPSVY
jgi:frataxin-like iron-binding protein CyaY